MLRSLRSSVSISSLIARHRHSASAGAAAKTLDHVNNGKYRDLINALLPRIAEDAECVNNAKDHLIDALNWKSYVNNFRRKLIKDPRSIYKTEDDLQELLSVLDKAAASNPGILDLEIPLKDPESLQAQSSLFSVTLASAKAELLTVINTNKILANTSDLRMPHEWYPYARLTKRKIYYHGGPTNSGKTYHAIQRLKAADPAKGGGLYCGPLRLLALEIYDTLNRAGVPTDLLTGQERKLLPGSSHTSSTVEMVNINQNYDVAVIDEIQMIADSNRAHSWTRALLGLRAREIHLCGGMEAAELVESLCASTKDDFELIKYERMSKLVVEPEAFRGDYSKIRAGDCVVAFSVVDIFSIRKHIEEQTQLKCAVIYGQLPPETRSTQARLFNDEKSGYDVLVASDAIGMGLNLNIGRIIFHTTVKQGDDGIQFISPTHIKQIAGRAGRKSSKFDVGKVTAWQEVDLAYVRAVMDWDIPSITAAGIFPNVDQVRTFIRQLLAHEKLSAEAKAEDDLAGKEEDAPSRKEDHSWKPTDDDNWPQSAAAAAADPQDSQETSLQLSAVIDKFVGLSKIDPRYFMTDYGTFSTVTNWLHTIPMSLEDKFTFAAAPASFHNQVIMQSLYEYAALYVCGRPVPLKLRLHKMLPTDIDSFKELCFRHNTLELYLWLSNRFPGNFIEKENCVAMKNFAIRQIERSLPAHTFNDEKSIHEKYQKMRNRLDKAALPPLQYGQQLRDSTEKYLAAIPDDLKVVDPNPTEAKKKKPVVEVKKPETKLSSRMNSRLERRAKLLAARKNKEKPSAKGSQKDGVPVVDDVELMDVFLNAL